MNAARRQRPSISPKDIELLLFHLEDARDMIVKYVSAQGFTSLGRATADRAKDAIDYLAGHITGDRRRLWSKAVTDGGHDQEIEVGSN